METDRHGIGNHQASNNLSWHDAGKLWDPQAEASDNHQP